MNNKVYLIDGAIVPGEGIYIFQNLDEDGFRDKVRDAMKGKQLQCHILDKELCGTLSQLTGVVIMPPLTRDARKVKMENGDQLIVVSLAQGENLEGMTVTMRTTLMTHFNDNPAGITALIDTQSKAGLTPDYLAELAVYLDNAGITLDKSGINLKVVDDEEETDDDMAN